MGKEKQRVQAEMVLDRAEFKKYCEWLDKPWVEKYPHLTNLILGASLTLNVVLIATLTQ